MPLLVEASYLKAYPEDRKGRAFVEFAAEGDANAMLDILAKIRSGEEGEEEQSLRTIDILRYQDPLREMSTALHVAVENHNQIVAWLLLWLASSLDSSVFPAEVVRLTQEMGILRQNMRNRVDIRSLENEDGKTAGQLAAMISGVWDQWVMKGWLDR